MDVGGADHERNRRRLRQDPVPAFRRPRVLADNHTAIERLQHLCKSASDCLRRRLQLHRVGHCFGTTLAHQQLRTAPGRHAADSPDLLRGHCSKSASSQCVGQSEENWKLLDRRVQRDVSSDLRGGSAVRTAHHPWVGHDVATIVLRACRTACWRRLLPCPCSSTAAKCRRD